MERHVQYAKTADGVSIALWTLGEGEPLVYMTGGPWNHIELWEIPECRRWYELLAQNRMLIRYDVRGTGLSDREVVDYSLDAQVLDLEAVVDHLGLDRLSLFGAANAGPVALAYAVRHVERLSRLVLWCSWAKGLHLTSPRLQAWLGLIDQDWELMTDTCVHLALGWTEGDLGRLAAEYLRESVTPDVLRADLDAAASIDVTELLAEVRTPTLVIGRPEISWIPSEATKALASWIPNARLTLLKGESTAPYLGDIETAVEAVEAFWDAVEITPAVQSQASVGRMLPGSGGAELEHGRTRAYTNGLTDREVQVLRLVAGGRTNKEIAVELVLSVRTIERHIGNIYGKIGARGKADAASYALTRGLV